MLERDIKKYLVARCTELGIYHRKFTSPGFVGVPDWILVNNGRTIFLELKAPGKKPTGSQAREMARIVSSGGYATWASSVPEIEFIISYLASPE